MKKFFYFIMNFCFLLVCVLFRYTYCHDGSFAVRFDTSSFEENVAKSSHFVMFFAPWCGHCKRLAPTWEELAEKYNKRLAVGEDGVTVAKVDCTTDTGLCSEQDVTGYPTLKFFKRGTNPIRYRGKRDMESLEQFIREQIGTYQVPEGVLEVPQAQHSLTELNAQNFHKHIEIGFHFVKFYAPWCGHCQKLAPVWDALADSLKYDGAVSISKVDCTVNGDLCQEFEVKGYPTLVWIHDGKEIAKYQGSRTHEDLKDYIVKMKGQADVVSSMDEGRIPDISISPAVQLTVNNFQTGIAVGTTFVKFFAPWCAHCKKLAPTWDELAMKFIGSVNVKIAKVDCTVGGNRQLCNDNGVEGYPTLLLFKNGEKIREYSGVRDLSSLHEFVLNNISHDEL